jgi:dynein heavy chain
LDVAVLTAGVDAFLQRLKKLPKDLQLTFPYKTLFEKINSFKDSIPLFADLKVHSFIIKEKGTKKNPRIC